MTNDQLNGPGADSSAVSEDWQDGTLLERFLSRRDQGAFLILVRRHGPMILGTCRRILSNASDVDDAFQTVFLVLLRKASELRGRANLGNWLYGVAFHTALKARALAMKRRAKESAALPRNISDASPDLAEAIDSELARLPEKYREPIVLCDLEDLPRKTVAQKLGIPEGTLSSRLTTARKMLGGRLLRKGLVVPVAGLKRGGRAGGVGSRHYTRRGYLGGAHCRDRSGRRHRANAPGDIKSTSGQAAGCCALHGCECVTSSCNRRSCLFVRTRNSIYGA